MIYEFKVTIEKLIKYLNNGSFDDDGCGQIVFYTGLYIDDDGNITTEDPMED
tara:strand:+ start:747 stop:902 length:156 start_codon:yes stop_codon:yes gene_type:complete